MHSNWQTDFFRGVALEFWRRSISPEQTHAEVEFLERILGTAPGAQILDVPCGNGRHALELASRGYCITGVDLSPDFIAEARGRTSSRARWILGDMCELPGLAEFDGAYCFGNSFGYLDHDGARRFLSAVAGTLKPGARFVVETGMAAESILPTLLKKRWHRSGDIFVLSENHYHPAEGRLDIQYTFIQSGDIDTRPTASYVFTVAEICRMQAEAGFQIVELLGSVSGEPYRIGSPNLILVSVKR